MPKFLKFSPFLIDGLIRIARKRASRALIPALNSDESDKQIYVLYRTTRSPLFGVKIFGPIHGSWAYIPGGCGGCFRFKCSGRTAWKKSPLEATGPWQNGPDTCTFKITRQCFHNPPPFCGVRSVPVTAKIPAADVFPRPPSRVEECVEQQHATPRDSSHR